MRCVWDVLCVRMRRTVACVCAREACQQGRVGKCADAPKMRGKSEVGGEHSGRKIYLFRCWYRRFLRNWDFFNNNNIDLMNFFASASPTAQAPVTRARRTVGPLARTRIEVAPPSSRPLVPPSTRKSPSPAMCARSARHPRQRRSAWQTLPVRQTSRRGRKAEVSRRGRTRLTPATDL